MTTSVFKGCIPALMTPCNPDRTPNFDALVRKGRELMDLGMSGVVYCGSMGDWPLLTDADGQEGCVRVWSKPASRGCRHRRGQIRSSRSACRTCGQGRRGRPHGDPARSVARHVGGARRSNHFSAILEAANGLPAVIYNSPYYGFATRADLFFELRAKYSNLVGFKEFGGKADMTMRLNTSRPAMRADAHGRRRHRRLSRLRQLRRGRRDHRRRQRTAEGSDCIWSISAKRPLPAMPRHAPKPANWKKRSWFFRPMTGCRPRPALQVHDGLNGEREYELHFNETDKLSASQQLASAREPVQAVQDLVQEPLRRVVHASRQKSKPVRFRSNLTGFDVSWARLPAGSIHGAAFV